VARLKPSLDLWRQATDRLATASADIDRLRAALDAAWPEDVDRGDLDDPASITALAGRMASDADALEAADRTYRDLVRRQAELDGAEEALASRRSALEAAATALAAADERVDALRVAVVDATGRAAGLPDARVRRQGLEEALVAAGRRDAALADVARLQAAVADALVAEDGAAARVVSLRTVWRAGLAGRLAESLVEGEPCPTCGSTDHPSPAALAGDVPTDEELATAEEALRDRSAASQAVRVELATAEATAAALADGSATGADELARQLEGARAAESACEAAEAEVAALAEEQARVEHERTATRGTVDRETAALQVDGAALGARREQWESERDTFVAAHGALAPTAEAASARRVLADGLSRLAEAVRDARQAAAGVAQGSAALGPTLVEFGVHDPSDLERWARPAEAVEEEARALEARARARHDVSSRLAAYEAAGGPTERPDLTPLLASERAVAERHDDLVGRHAVVQSRLESVDTARAQLSTRADEVESARGAKEEAETLYAACAGHGAGAVGSRVSLHTWVLAYYLRQVLAQANVRLDTMTSGRFALELDQGSVDGRKASGLDLSVLDAETGQRRPATTLSGGETFMAALALALGLADVVAAGSNYAIGALFVDEGFGSLDGESLDTVVDVLRSLQDGGRMVGVISHVQELQAALPNGIAVEPTSEGSVATIHYPDR